MNAISLAVPAAFWRQLRTDFERLEDYQFTLVWCTRLPLDSDGNPLASHWTWREPQDASLRARFSAIAERGARALGHATEDGWYDELRMANFVGFELSGVWKQQRADGSFVVGETGSIYDVAKESITLCHLLEAAAERDPAAGLNRLTPERLPPSENPLLRAQIKPKPSVDTFTARAAWLRARLEERAWGTSDPHRQHGPDRKTIEKILRGEAVREDVLERLAHALSKKLATVSLVDIPRG